MVEYSLLLIKPDALEKGLVDDVERALQNGGLRVVMRGSVQLTMDTVRVLYHWDVVHAPAAVEGYLCRMPMPLWLVVGEGAMQKCLEIKAALRARYCTDRLHTLFHCPDSSDDFRREFLLLFPGEALPDGGL